MIEHAELKQKTHTLWAEQPTDFPNTLNAFDGTFAFTEHDLVPELIVDLVMSQRNEDKFDKVPLSAVNAIANGFWEGPGSCARISDVIWDCRIARAHGAKFTESKSAWTLGYTVEDWEAIADGQED